MGLTFFKKNGEMDILNWGPNIHVTLFDAPKSLVALKKTALARGVKMMDKIYAIDLLKRDDKVVGAIGLGLVDGKTYLFNAKVGHHRYRQLRLHARKDLQLRPRGGCGDGLPRRGATY